MALTVDGKYIHLEWIVPRPPAKAKPIGVQCLLWNYKAFAKQYGKGTYIQLGYTVYTAEECHLIGKI